MRRHLATSVAVLMCTLAVGACAPSSPAPQTSNTSAQDADWQQRSYPEIYGQELVWSACASDVGLSEETNAALMQVGVDPEKVQCSKVTVPMNWTDVTDTRRAEVALVRIPSTGPNPRGPLFGNPGGPGIPGRTAAVFQALSPGFEEVLQNYDLIGFDPRGIGASTPLTCSPSSAVPAVRLAECLKTDPISHHMGTAQVARDMELLRALLNAEEFDYLGYSYGTILGATYATLFPNKVGRMVLDSAEDSNWASPQHTFDQQVAVARAIGVLVDRCPSLKTSDGAASTCPFNSQEELLNLRSQLEATPWTATDGTVFGAKELTNYLTSALYQDVDTQVMSLETLAKARTGGQSAIDDLVARASEDDVSVDLSGEIVMCHSFPENPDIAGLAQHVKEVGVPELLGGKDGEEDQLTAASDLSCGLLEEPKDNPETFHASNTRLPILVIGITGDHATPYQFSKSLANQLGNARHLTLEGEGHGASYTGRSSCTDKAVTQFLLSGQAPEEGTTCRDD